MYTAEEINRANNTSIYDYLLQNGYAFITRSGGMVSLKEHDSLFISIDKNKWYWFSRQIGGTGCLDFVKKYEGLPFKAAMQKIIGKDEPTYLSFKKPITPFSEKKTAFILPEKASSMDKVYRYLCDLRKIDKRIVHRMVKENRLYQDVRNNCVFVGFDNTGIARYGLRVGTNPDYKFKGEVKGGSKAYAPALNANPSSNTVLVFESIIDAMSYETLVCSLYENAIALSGVCDRKLAQYLKDNPCINKIIFMLDNDEAGRTATKSLSEKYLKKGYEVNAKFSEEKDWNEDLNNSQLGNYWCNITKKVRDNEKMSDL